ncbi:MAG: hypothetical protein JOZ45_15745 [Acidobacteriaceae bacterium]|nr:hypothetical protein [Acidobacteriaceae bacterium]
MLKRLLGFLAFWMTVSIVCAAEFQTGEAARAVIGQPSFTAHETGVSAQSLSFSNGKLYVADASGRVLTFDHIPPPGEDLPERAGSPCAVCGFSPSATTSQPVSLTAAQYSSFGNAVAMVDTRSHRVLLWRDVHSSQAAGGPDVILEADSDGGAIDNTTLIEPVSVALDGKRLFVGDRALRRILVWNTLPAGGDVGADAVLGQSSFVTLDSTITGPDHFADPQALVSDGVNLFVADKGNRRILVFSPGDLPLSEGSVVNSANFKAGPLAPGTLITINGQHFSEVSESAPDDGEHPLPLKLAGVQVLLDGRKLPLLSVSPLQIRSQLPYSFNGTESVYVRVEFSNGVVMTTNAVAVQATPASPGIFAMSGSEPRSGMLLHAKEDAAGSGALVTSDDPAKPGEVLTVWATGLGSVSPLGSEETAEAGHPYSASDSQTQIPVEAYLNGQSLPVLHAGLPQGTVGVYELRVLLPESLPPGRTANLLISQAGVNSNTVTVPIESTIH